MNHVDESDTLNSGATQSASASVDTTQSSLAHDGLGARAEDDAAVTTQIEITIQGGKEEHSGMAGGDDGQYNTGASQETTQEGPDITPATGKTPVPSASTNDTLVNSMANNGSGCRTKVEDAITDQGVIVSQGENAEQSRMAGGGAGQHTTGATEPPGGMSSGDLSTWTRARKPDRARYKPGQGLTKVKGQTSTSGPPAATAAQPTPKSVGSKRPTPDSSPP